MSKALGKRDPFVMKTATDYLLQVSFLPRVTLMYEVRVLPAGRPQSYKFSWWACSSALLLFWSHQGVGSIFQLCSSMLTDERRYLGQRHRRKLRESIYENMCTTVLLQVAGGGGGPCNHCHTRTLRIACWMRSMPFTVTESSSNLPQTPQGLQMT